MTHNYDAWCMVFGQLMRDKHFEEKTLAHISNLVIQSSLSLAKAEECGVIASCETTQPRYFGDRGPFNTSSYLKNNSDSCRLKGILCEVDFDNIMIISIISLFILCAFWRRFALPTIRLIVQSARNYITKTLVIRWKSIIVVIMITNVAKVGGGGEGAI